MQEKLKKRIEDYETDLKSSNEQRMQHQREVAVLTQRIEQLQGAVFALKSVLEEASTPPAKKLKPVENAPDGNAAPAKS